MSAKTVVIVVLVCATGAAVYLLRSHNTDKLVASGGPASIADVRDGARPDLEVEQPETVEGADSSTSSSSNDDPFATASDKPPVMFEHQIAATPISQALDDLKFTPIPELLEAERAFAAERTDPLWADAMEGQILGEIARTTGLQLVTLQEHALAGAKSARERASIYLLVRPSTHATNPRRSSTEADYWRWGCGHFLVRRWGRQRMLTIRADS